MSIMLKSIGGGTDSLAGFWFVVASMTSIGSLIESSIVNLFVVLTGLVDDIYVAVFISPSLSSLRFLLLLLSRLICSDDPAIWGGKLMRFRFESLAIEKSKMHYTECGPVTRFFSTFILFMLRYVGFRETYTHWVCSRSFTGFDHTRQHATPAKCLFLYYFEAHVSEKNIFQSHFHFKVKSNILILIYSCWYSYGA